MTCRAATGEAVEAGVIVGSPVTGPLCVVGVIEPDEVVDDDGAAMVVSEDTAVAIGTDKEALKAAHKQHKTRGRMLLIE
jgi:hypothetical protein